MVIQEKNRAGLILLGASSFPRSGNFQGDSAFLAASQRIKNYFVNPDGLGLEETNVLDLFDKEQDADSFDMSISDFIKELRTKNIQDLFIYYVGHGGFSERDRGFFLATKHTRDSNLAVSSITLRSLSGTIAQFANQLRTYFILDCCFSAQAGTSFMADSNSIIGQQLLEEYPTKGVTLLCSSSKDLPSLIIKERNITMFTEGFDMALRKGDSGINSKYLSLKDIHRLTYSYIKQLNPGKEIRPEIISPVQPAGDIAEIPYFFNYGYKDAKADILAKKREIDNEMVKNNVISMCNLFIDFVRNFDLELTYDSRSIDIGSACYDLEEEKSGIDRNTYKERRNVLYRQIRETMSAIIHQSPANLPIRDN